jgi:hypothetical protein
VRIKKTLEFDIHTPRPDDGPASVQDQQLSWDNFASAFDKIAQEVPGPNEAVGPITVHVHYSRLWVDWEEEVIVQ